MQACVIFTGQVYIDSVVLANITNTQSCVSQVNSWVNSASDVESRSLEYIPQSDNV